MLDVGSRLRGPAAPAAPAGRDRAVDALRAFAILGVVLGHWLVTAFVATGDGDGLRVTSPLAAMPALAPLTWVLQTLAVFFLVGGYAAGKGLRPDEPWGARLRRRLARLARPLPVLLAAWVPAAAGLWWAGFPGDSVYTLVKLVLSPLWFLCVYVVLTAFTPAIAAVWKRLGIWGAVLLVGATAAIDTGRFALGAPGWTGWITVLTGWLVPFYLGIAWADGALRSRRAGLVLLAGGAAATALLILYAGYPASMVGVPGAATSNLSPPTLAAVAFGLAQTGLALLLHGPLTRWTRRARAWPVIAAANRSALTIFLWHQTALMAVTVGAFLAADGLPGLLTPPDRPGWVAARLAWLPVFALALAGIGALAHRFGRSRRPGAAADPNLRHRPDISRRTPRFWRPPENRRTISDGRKADDAATQDDLAARPTAPTGPRLRRDHLRDHADDRRDGARGPVCGTRPGPVHGALDAGRPVRGRARGDRAGAQDGAAGRRP
ncbi:acyltransferase family protein [Actinomadura rubrisoli]|uniref:acyltransferase family protein n=1 Tax=Actinomadura rubrisoli TaxID=2530368 RepID=UPI001FB67739|nr:acyltransferase [Actinomadura rubrisoli]